MRKFGYISTAVMLLSISCARHENRSDIDSVSYAEYDTIVNVVDSTSKEELSKDSIVKETVDPDLASLTDNEALIKMKSSQDWVKYSKGILPWVSQKSVGYANRLLDNEYNRFLVVDKSRMKVLLFDKYGRLEKEYGMACAKNYGTKHKKADARTPEGFFSVEGIYDSTDWLFVDDKGKKSQIKGQFGPRFIRLRIPGTTQIGIHGTCAPWSIGTRASHGCIRVTNENIMELIEFVEVGMPAIIVPGKKDIAVNKNEGYDIPWIPTTFTSQEPKIGETKKKEADKEASTLNKKEERDSVTTQPEQPDTLKSEEAKPLEENQQ